MPLRLTTCLALCLIFLAAPAHAKAAAAITLGQAAAAAAITLGQAAAAAAAAITPGQAAAAAAITPGQIAAAIMQGQAAAITPSQAGATVKQGQAAAAIKQGQRLWQQRCTDCHALDTDQTGPRHRGVFGRRAGSIKGYDYSRALKRSQVTWDAASLDRWLTDPERFIPGQNMDFKVPSASERAALIAYLQSLSQHATGKPSR